MSRGAKERRKKGSSRGDGLDWSDVCCLARPGSLAGDDDEDALPYCRNSSGAFDPERLSRAYALDGASNTEFPDGSKWAFACVYSMQIDHPREALEIIRLAAQASETDRQRVKIGCGNLESLLGNHGEAIIGEVERLARQEAKFRECLTHVWRHGMTEDVWQRVLKASGRSGV